MNDGRTSVFDPNDPNGFKPMLLDGDPSKPVRLSGLRPGVVAAVRAQLASVDGKQCIRDTLETIAKLSQENAAAMLKNSTNVGQSLGLAAAAGLGAAPAAPHQASTETPAVYPSQPAQSGYTPFPQPQQFPQPSQFSQSTYPPAAYQQAAPAQYLPPVAYTPSQYPPGPDLTSRISRQPGVPQQPPRPQMYQVLFRYPIGEIASSYVDVIDHPRFVVLVSDATQTQGFTPTYTETPFNLSLPGNITYAVTSLDVQFEQAGKSFLLLFKSQEPG